MAIMQVSNLTKKFGGVTANKNVSFEVKENQIVGIIGPNGAGKTTCFNSICGFTKKTEGQVLFGDKDISNLVHFQIAGLGICRTFQHTTIFPEFTVMENILAGMYLKAETGIFSTIFKYGKIVKQEQKLEEAAHKIIKMVRLTGKENSIAKNLAYGQQRKLAIGIALATSPKVLMLDEPAAGLNATESKELVELIRDVSKTGITVVLVEHDMKVVMSVCDNIIVLNYGEKMAEGTPAEIRKNEKVIEVYLGTETD